MQQDAAREFAGDATEKLHGVSSSTQVRMTVPLQRTSDRGTILTVKIIHFTEGSTDPIEDFEARGVRYVPLASAQGEVGASVVSCFHISAGGRITETPCVHDCVLLVVHGRLTLWGIDDPERIYLFPGRHDIYGGMGVVLNAGEPMRIESDDGAIVIAVEAPQLLATARGLSTPDRLWHQRWPGEKPPRRTLRTIIRTIRFRIRYWRMIPWFARRSAHTR
jgi:hypothetical protein